MKRLLPILLCGFVAAPLFSGCGKPGIDAETATAGGPRLTQHRPQKEQVQQFMADLQKTGADAPGQRQMNMYITMLAKMGAEAQPAIPVLQKVAADTTNDQSTRDRAKQAIEEITAAADD